MKIVLRGRFSCVTTTAWAETYWIVKGFHVVQVPAREKERVKHEAVANCICKEDHHLHMTTENYLQQH